MIKQLATSGRFETSRNILLAGAVGLVAGIGAIVFHWLCNFITHFTFDGIAGVHAHGPEGESHFFSNGTNELVMWLIILVPTCGAILSGWLVYTYAPEAEGHGTDSAIDSYHNKQGRIRGRVPFIKMLSSAITLGTGGSGGREGPIAQIGAGFGSFMATKLNLSHNDRRTLMAAGVGAGIGAIFQAPLAGAIFAAEVMYSDPEFESENLIPAFMATAIAYCAYNMGMMGLIDMGFVAHGAEGFGTLFNMPNKPVFDNPLMLMPLTVLAIAMVMCSWVYVRGFYGIHDLFQKMPIPRLAKPVIGAALTGVLGVIFYQGMLAYSGEFEAHQSLSVMAFGYGFLQDILSADSIPMGMIVILLVVGVGKFLTTSLTIGSGGSGGIFGPSMVIGGCLGTVVGVLFHEMMPGTVIVEAGRNDVIVFTLLGMASFFAAAANTPLSTLIMVSEMTGSYALLMPSMWVCAIAYILGRNFTIYVEQVRTRRDSPAHKGDFIVDVLEGLSVKDALSKLNEDFITIKPDMVLNDIVKMIADTRQTTFPVVGEDGKLTGIFGLSDVREFLHECGGMGDLAVAMDLAITTDAKLFVETSLSEAISEFARGNYEELPVVRADAEDVVVGMVRRQDVIAVYSSTLLRMKQEQVAEV